MLIMKSKSPFKNGAKDAHRKEKDGEQTRKSPNPKILKGKPHLISS